MNGSKHYLLNLNIITSHAKALYTNTFDTIFKRIFILTFKTSAKHWSNYAIGAFEYRLLINTISIMQTGLTSFYPLAQHVPFLSIWHISCDFLTPTKIWILHQMTPFNCTHHFYFLFLLPSWWSSKKTQQENVYVIHETKNLSRGWILPSFYEGGFPCLMKCHFIL